MSSPTPQTPRQNFILGARVFAVIGVVFTIIQVFSPDGPLRWIALMVAVVCLLRALYYFLRAIRSPVATPPPEDHP